MGLQWGPDDGDPYLWVNGWISSAGISTSHLSASQANMTTLGVSSSLSGPGGFSVTPSGINLGNSANQLLQLPPTTNQTGRNLTLQAGSVGFGEHQHGGKLVLSSGASAGGGWGTIEFRTAIWNPTSPFTINQPRTAMTINGAGGVGIGDGSGTGLFWGSMFSGLDVSWGGVPGTLSLGADINQKTRTEGRDKHMSIVVPAVSNTQKPMMFVWGMATSNGHYFNLGLGGDYWPTSAATDIALHTSHDLLESPLHPALSSTATAPSPSAIASSLKRPARSSWDATTNPSATVRSNPQLLSSS
jgi:hypothetical protein